MNFTELLSRGFVIIDGGWGTMLQQEGILNDELVWERTGYRDTARRIHRAYREAGAQVITADTFQANLHTLGSPEKVAEIIAAAIATTKEAAEGKVLVALDIGPLGPLMAPMGELTFEEAYSQFAEIAKAGANAGADLVIIETMSDLLEIKAAVLAIRENCALPIVATMSYGAGGRTFVGCDPVAATLTLQGLGVSAAGANCSLGPDALAPVFARIAEEAALPLAVQPNAGLPRTVGGATVYDVNPQTFAQQTTALVQYGVRVLGGCCGTTPAHIRALAETLTEMEPVGLPPRPADVATTKDSFIYPEELANMETETLAVAMESDPEALLADAMDLADECDLLWLDLESGVPPALLQEVESLAGVPVALQCADSATLLAAARTYAGRPFVRYTGGDPGYTLTGALRSCGAVLV